MKIKRVLLSMHMSGIAGRAMLRGASSFAKANREWTCNIHPPEEKLFEAVISWRPEGVLVESWDEPVGQAFRKAGIPVLEIGPSVNAKASMRGKWNMGVDNLAVGAMAADYYIAKGYRHLAFVGLSPKSSDLVREQGFRRAAEAAGVKCATRFLYPLTSAVMAEKDVEQALAEWVGTLPRPVGIFAANDGRGLQVLEVAHQYRLNVPDDYAVLGVDDDEVLCEAIHPPLSSVALPWERVGYEAASMLDRILEGKMVPRGSVLLPPVRVITRQSSDALAIHDEDLAAAVKFIRQHAAVPIQVDDVIEQVNISRRSLERRFQTTLGHTLLDEIHAAHLEAARQLLIHTDLAMPQVAVKSGFTDERRMWSAFKVHAEMTPSEFRRQFRLR